MSHPREQPAANRNDVLYWWLFALIFLASLAAISSQSLWIDEAITAWQASLPDIKSCWRQMIADRGSELQMPLFMGYLWAWEKLVGVSELALRLGNLPWVLLGFGAWLKAFSGDKHLRIGVALTTAFSPFVWFYLNEARPYVMQLGGAFLIFAALYRLVTVTLKPEFSKRPWAIGLAAGIFIVCASSMLGVLWVAAAMAIAIISMGKDRTWNLLKAFPFLWLLTFIGLALLGIYFLWTLKQGARASGAAGTDLKNLFFIAYEFFGFTGLGPGRLEIRESGLGSFRPYAPLLFVYSLSLAGVLLMAWRERNKLAAKKNLFCVAIFLTGTTLIILVMGHVAHFRVLGRHLAPLIVMVLFLLGFGVAQCLFRPGIFWKSIALIFVGLNIFSCLSLRFSFRHQKDDYRSAARVAKAELAAGRSVWWNADGSGALYYRIPISEEVSPGSAWLLRNPETNSLANRTPDVVITSKPDIYDGRNVLGEFLQKQNYLRRTNFPAFTIWEKSRE